MFSLGGRRTVRNCFKIFRLTLVQFSNLHDLHSLNVVKTVEKTIEQNTSIFIESPIDVRVQPIDCNDIRTHNKLTMTLYSQGLSTSDFMVKQTSKRLELLNRNTSADRSDVCVVQVPYHINVQVTATENASVHMSKLEGEKFIVKTKNGNVTAVDLKAQDIRIDSAAGDLITEGKLQASTIDFKTGLDGSISCGTIMSNVFNVSTHGGTVSVKACYSDKSHFTTLMGNMELDNLHKSVLIDVIQKGNLNIKNFDGNLHASLKSGNVYILASQLADKSSIFIHEKGRVEVLIPNILKNLPATNLIAEKIFVEDKIMKLGRFMDDSHPKRFRFEKEPQNELHIVCRNGSIELKESNLLPFVTKV